MYRFNGLNDVEEKKQKQKKKTETLVPNHLVGEIIFNLHETLHKKRVGWGKG